MKRNIIILFIFTALTLGACGSNTSNKNIDDTNNIDDNQEGSADNQNYSEDEGNIFDEIEYESENNPGNGNENANNPGPEEALSSEFQEYETLVNEIDLDALKAYITTDNRNTRVIIYSDPNGRKVSKSIFIKKQNRLKIIEFDTDKEIFNQVIQ